MSFLKSVFENIGELGSIGDQARADARAAGIDSYYIDPERQGLVLLEHPDGRVEPEGDAFQNRRKIARK